MDQETRSEAATRIVKEATACFQLRHLMEDSVGSRTDIVSL